MSATEKRNTKRDVGNDVVALFIGGAMTEDRRVATHRKAKRRRKTGCETPTVRFSTDERYVIEPCGKKASGFVMDTSECSRRVCDGHRSAMLRLRLEQATANTTGDTDAS
jgi:hypothetical protein